MGKPSLPHFITWEENTNSVNNYLASILSSFLSHSFFSSSSWFSQLTFFPMGYSFTEESKHHPAWPPSYFPLPSPSSLCFPFLNCSADTAWQFIPRLWGSFKTANPPAVEGVNIDFLIQTGQLTIGKASCESFACRNPIHRLFATDLWNLAGKMS